MDPNSGARGAYSKDLPTLAAESRSSGLLNNDLLADDKAVHLTSKLSRRQRTNWFDFEADDIRADTS
jgi:hypothetical protein